MFRIELAAAVAPCVRRPGVRPGLQGRERGHQAERQDRGGASVQGFGWPEEISPALKWSGTPKGAKSFAFLVHDPDAPTGGAGWWHWVVINIPAAATELKKDAGKGDGANLPAGSGQVNTNFGGPGWGGPCPPAGDKPHRYNFSLHALKVQKLDVPPNATASLAGFMVNANSAGKATLTGTYGRSK